MNSYSFLLLCLARCQHAAAMAVVLLACSWPMTVRADETAPLFGGTSLYLQSASYEWQSATENGTYHVDTYTGSGATVTVTGLISAPVLATVNGNGLNGYLQNGNYGDLVQSGSIGVAVNLGDRSYNLATATTTYTVDLPNGQLNSATTTTFSGPGGSFTVATNGDITGSEFGYVVNDTWYVNSSYASPTSLSFNGHEYTAYVSNTTYAKDGSGAVVGSTVQTYSGNGCNFTVDASGAISGTESGYYRNSNWYVNTFSTSDFYFTSPAGRSYNLRSTAVNYGLDGSGQITSATTQVYSGGSGAFTVAPDGTVSGSEHGFYSNNQLYLDSAVVETADYTTPGGRHYTQHRTAGTIYERDGSGVVATTLPETYSGPGGLSFTIAADGGISGAESGGRDSSGNLQFDGSWATTTPSSGSSSLSLFGGTYTFTGGSTWASYQANGQTASSGWSDSYANNEGSNATIAYSGTTGSSPTLSGWDCYVGSFSSDSNGNLNFEPRYGPSFQPGQLWVNAMLVNWQSGTVDSSGTVTDSYGGSDAQGAALTLVISGSRRSYATGAGSASVSINGSNAGTLSLSGGFSPATGYDVQASDPNRSTPLFAGAALWVNGSALPFSGGWEDSTGHRTDRYATSDGWLTLVGSSAAPTTATVQVGWNSTIYAGSFNGGSFEVGDELTIATVPPESGPPALWAAGRLYVKPTGQNRYVHTIMDSQGTVTASYHLNLSGADATHYTLNGTGASGVLAGTFDASAGGVFLLMQNGSTPVAALPANEDGTPRLSGEERPEHFPPAVMVTGAGILGFVGTVNSGASACYTNPGALGNAEPDVGALCLLQLGTDGSVTLTNYSTGSTLAGSYSTTTHLFQTGTSSSLPMPLVGVNPNMSDTLWGLSSPAEGPASFLVGNDVWRYAGAGSNGAALYQGYYGGQQLSLGTAGTGGGRQVTVTDPLHGNTSGMLNDVRAGTRLGNGTMVYAGGSDGARQQSTINNNNLAALTGNLDIPGNMLSLGSLSDNAAAAGLTLQFSDNGTQAMLSTTLGRSAAQWAWWRMNPNDPSARLPVMALDNHSSFGLVLYHPDTAQATIQLNPAAGTITLGGSPVLTQNSGDARYVQAAQVGGSNSTILTQQAADMRYRHSDQPLRLTPAGDVLMDAEFQSGPQP